MILYHHSSLLYHLLLVFRKKCHSNICSNKGIIPNFDQREAFPANYYLCNHFISLACINKTALLIC
jgi:hypothetical protein